MITPMLIFSFVCLCLCIMLTAVLAADLLCKVAAHYFKKWEIRFFDSEEFDSTSPYN